MRLCFQPELEAKLNSDGLRQLKQRIAIRRRINPLSRAECLDYIEHRLHIVGSETSRVFTSGATRLICLHCKGIPRLINVICDNALLIGYSLSRKKIDAEIIEEVIRDMDGVPVNLPAAGPQSGWPDAPAAKPPLLRRIIAAMTWRKREDRGQRSEVGSQ